MRFFRKLVVVLVIVAIVFTAIMGFAHTRWGHPLLALMMPLLGKSVSCPLGYDHRVSLEDRQKMRDAVAAKWTGRPFAASRGALDFVIGKTSRSEAEAWAKTQGGACRALHTPYETECDGKFFHSDTSALWLEFDSNKNLISMRGIEKFKSPEMAVEFFRHLKKRIKEVAGSSMIESGQPTVDKLRTRLLYQASAASGFRNYSVVARVTNMGDSYAVTNDFLGF
jgi:hypothetical protein